MEGREVRLRQIVNSVFSSNTFIIECDCVGYLVDCGDIDEVLKKSVEGIAVKGVFLTHTHFDHIYGIVNLLSIYPECVVYTSEFGQKALASSKLNFSRYCTEISPIEFSSPNVRVVYDGGRIPLFDNVEMEIMETPGHDNSCLCYRMKDYFFTGDSFIPGMKTITTFKGSNKDANRISLTKIRSAITDEVIICPGHGEMVKGNSYSGPEM